MNEDGRSRNKKVGDRVMIFLVVALVALAVVWWYARHVKEDLDESSRIVSGARGVIDLTPAGFQVVELAPGVSFDYLRQRTGGKLLPRP